MSNDMTWRTSRRSGSGATNCVELGITESKTYVRDSKDRAGGTLRFSSHAWVNFVNEIKDDKLNEKP